jgi:uncharacterized membrane protein
MLASRYAERFAWAVGLLSLADICLWMLRVLLTGTTRYAFVPWNLILAWISPLLAYALVRNLRRYRWMSWRNLVLSALWLGFLPNTWYVLTDFVHIVPNGEISQLYDIVLISLLVFVGFILGFASLFLVHRELMRRLSLARAYLVIETVILIASFSIYIGRDLRWNTWDVITNPGAIISVSDRIADPLGSPRAFNVTILFFTLISLLYLSFWIISRPPPKPARR